MVVLIIILLILFVLYLLKNSLLFKKVRFQLKFVVYFVWVGLVCLAFFPVLLLRPHNDNNGLLVSGVAKLVTKLLGVKWRLRNGVVLSKEQPGVIVANHQSSMDLLGVFKIWGTVRKMAAVAKHTFVYSGPIAYTGYLCGMIYINRSDPKKAYKNLKKLQQTFKKKYKIFMCVEGTRNKHNDGTLLPFKKGAFNMAVESQVPIIPVVFSPYYFIDRKNYIFNKGEITLQCLEPISTVGLTMEDVPALTEKVRKIMLQTYQQLWQEVYNDSAMKNDKINKVTSEGD